MSTLHSRIAPGRSVAGYRIERLLGRGGMGVVYLAHGTGGPVALKLLDLGAAGGDLQLVFEREMALGRRLAHPGIVRVFDSGRLEDIGFVAMEYLAGGDLTQVRTLMDGLPPLPWVADIAQQAALALACAHEQGVLHRDVKPANVLLDGEARLAKLSDFGLARMADLQRSRTGVLAGTPAYMSPEQLADGAQDARSDLYSLGAVLFELLCGRPPHEAASLGALLRDVSTTPAPDVRALRTDVPALLSDLVARLLAKHPDQRPASARAVASELSAIGQAPGLPAGTAWPAAPSHITPA